MKTLIRVRVCCSRYIQSLSAPGRYKVVRVEAEVKPPEKKASRRRKKFSEGSVAW